MVDYSMIGKRDYSPVSLLDQKERLCRGTNFPFQLELSLVLKPKTNPSLPSKMVNPIYKR